MKEVEDMSPDELIAFIEKIQAQDAKRRAYHKDHSRATLREKIEKDPKAYLTRRKDYEEAERLGIDTKDLPKLNDL